MYSSLNRGPEGMHGGVDTARKRRDYEVGHMLVPVEFLREYGAFLDSFFAEVRVSIVVIVLFTVPCLLTMSDEMENWARLSMVNKFRITTCQNHTSRLGQASRRTVGIVLPALESV